MNSKVFRILEFDLIKQKLKNHAASSMGKELVEKLQPSSVLFEVEQALQQTNDAETCILKRGNPVLGGIFDVNPIVKRIQLGGVLNAGELLRVAGILGCSRKLKKYYSVGDDNLQNASYVGELIGLLQTNKQIEDAINTAILSEDEISDFASPQLKSIRRKIVDAQSSIKEKLNSVIKSNKYQKFLQDAIVTVRSDRYVIPVKAENKSEIPGLVHDSSASGQTLFIEPLAVVETNNKIRELKFSEQSEIERILADLTSKCAEIVDELVQNVELLGQLDFAFAKAKLSVELNCFKAKVNKNKKINIKKGRHPLLDKNIVVPIDFYLSDGVNTLIVTGPNTGGKTVTLKTVGLLTLMTQCGLNIPTADGTHIAIYDEIFADIGDEQSIEQSLSTFSSHMTNIVNILNATDNNSLVLLDELGAGTDPTEGAALAMAILETLQISGSTSLATTHYSELKQYALTTKGVENASCEFDINTLRPTYRLLIGVPGKSNAFEISKRLGLEDRIISRAREFLTSNDVKFEDIIIKLEKNRQIAEIERVKAEQERKKIEEIKIELESKKSDISKSREKMLRDSREQAHQIIENAKQQADLIISNLKEIEAATFEQSSVKIAEDLRLGLKKDLDQIEQDLSYDLKAATAKSDIDVAKLKVGENVEIINLNQSGTIFSLPKSNGELIVKVGNVKINSHVSNLRLVNKKQANSKNKNLRSTGKRNITFEKNLSQIREIDIRGMAVDEAELVLDKFIDDCSLAGVENASIIHGKGTGVLRSGVHRFLRKNPHVRTFRLGVYGEGESGVTIIEIKK